MSGDAENIPSGVENNPDTNKPNPVKMNNNEIIDKGIPKIRTYADVVKLNTSESNERTAACA